MKHSIIFTIFLFIFLYAQTQTTVTVFEPQIPILLEGKDNVLMYVRVDAKDVGTLSFINLAFADNDNVKDIKSVKVFYSGTEAIQRSKEMHYTPVDYLINRDLTANSSYSILKSEVKNPGKNLSFYINQDLFNGINYFWISIQMKPKASILTTLSAQITEVILNNKSVDFNIETPVHVRKMARKVRSAGDDGVAAYRIPGLITSNKGTLLAVYDVRYNSSVDLQDHIDVGMSRSFDKGQTWNKMQIPIQFGEYNGLPSAQNGVGDPAILVDKRTGTIWILALWTHGMGRQPAWFNSKPGMNFTETGQLMLVRSDDDGKTWSKPINITEQVKKPEWSLLLQGPGMGITMEDGALVFAIQYINANKIPCAAIMYSKDRGETWTTHTYARENTTEAQVAETAPGVLMLNMRDNRGGSRAVSVTEDLGKTWTEHASNRSALPESVCMASLLHVKANENALKRDILLFSNPADTKERKNITIKASLDGGVTWKESNQVLLDSGTGWGYSCLTLIDKETVGILYESSVAHMTFQAVKLSEIVKE